MPLDSYYDCCFQVDKREDPVYELYDKIYDNVIKVITPLIEDYRLSLLWCAGLIVSIITGLQLSAWAELCPISKYWQQVIVVVLLVLYFMGASYTYFRFWRAVSTACNFKIRAGSGYTLQSEVIDRCTCDYTKLRIGHCSFEDLYEVLIPKYDGRESLHQKFDDLCTAVLVANVSDVYVHDRIIKNVKAIKWTEAIRLMVMTLFVVGTTVGWGLITGLI